VVTVADLVGRVERTTADGLGVYDISDFAVDVVGGALHAGDDADDARWFPLDALPDSALTPGLLDALRTWGVVPTPAVD
jgi:8-oxo-dGTP diphosphatase